MCYNLNKSLYSGGVLLLENYSLLKEIFMIILYIASSLGTVGFLGWLIYDKLIFKEISLRKELFDNNNLSMWLEFTGGFLFPVLFLVSSIMAPTGKFVYKGELIDIVIAVSYISIYIILFSIFRYLSDLAVSYIGKIEYNTDISLKIEISAKKNISASLYSISISVIAIGILLQENLFAENLFTNFVRIAIVFALSLSLLSFYKTLFFPKQSSLFSELFIRRNTSSGLILLGHTVSVNLIIYYTIEWQKIPKANWLNINTVFDVTVFICLIYFIMLIFVTLSKVILNKVLNINLKHEIFDNNNIGYAIFESAFYILLSLVVINCILVV